MTNYVVILSDEDKIVTDVVALDDRTRADQLVQDLSGKFGRARVQMVAIEINVLPKFWGLEQRRAIEEQRSSIKDVLNELSDLTGKYFEEENGEM